MRFSASSRLVTRSVSLAVITFLMPATAVHAAETVTHQYDALGRLKQTTKTGGPATGVQTKTNHDPAGNRTCHSTTGVGGSSGTACPTPP